MANQQGWNQQSPAVQNMIRNALGTSGRRSTATGGKRRRKKAASAVSKVRKVARRAKSVAGRLKKGSAAAKRYMAKIRKLRGK